MHILYRVTFKPHLNTSLPKFYIGSKYNYRGNYYGSVDSKQIYPYTEGLPLREWWKLQKQNPENFDFEILQSFEDITPGELVQRERDLQQELDVLGDEYFNHSIACAGFFSRKRGGDSKRKVSEKTKQYWDSEAGVEKKKRLAQRNRECHSDVMRKRWEAPTESMLAVDRSKPKSEAHCRNISEGKKKQIEYRGETYRGWDELQEKTGVTKHLYRKYYLKGFNPEVNIGIKVPIFESL